jgi:hypothetical protein
MWAARILLSKDTTWPDYVFWDSIRRGKAAGYEIGGLFCLPIAQTITAYVMGDGMSASLMGSSIPKKDVESVHQDGKPTANLKQAAAVPQAKPLNSDGDPVAYTNMLLRTMMESNQALFQSTTVDAYCLAEQYVFVNPDGTFSVASPDTVTCEYSASDYRRLLRVIVLTKYVDSTVTDTYTDDKRTVHIHYYDARADVDKEFDNLIGRIPMVHFATDRGPNEIHGRPIYEAALPIMRRYDDLMYKTCDGVELMGNPLPIFEGLDNPGETLALNSTQEQYTDAEGNTQTRNLLRFDRNAGIFIGKGGSFKFGAPPVGFTKDSLDTLRQLFLLLLNHTRIPEFVWGGAISSSKASAETQLPPFIRYIEYRRLQLEGEGAMPALGIAARGGYLALIDIWLRTMKLLNPAIVVGAVRIDWPDIDDGDSQFKYMWGSYLSSAGKITDEDTIALAGFWDDPAAVVERAQGNPQRNPNYDEYDAKLRAARLAQAQAQMEPDNDNGEPFSTDWVTVHSNKSLTATGNKWSLVGPQVWEGEPGGYR